MRSHQPGAIVTARKPHARALRAHNNFCCTHGTRERAICGGRRSVGAAGLGALWMLLECYLSAGAA
eukprot:1955456-Lingulodinium_polyedra.AAC.1